MSKTCRRYVGKKCYDVIVNIFVLSNQSAFVKSFGAYTGAFYYRKNESEVIHMSENTIPAEQLAEEATEAVEETTEETATDASEEVAE